ncbi:MAG: hypothetical protein LAP40_20375 [Acidobacteriia bacterium]|nr:hypothetical protein [Terriglobia bacterium]
MSEPVTPRPEPGRVAQAILAAALVGAAILSLVLYGILPRVAGWLSPEQTEWLREAFRTHPYGVLLAILASSGVLSLPVLLVALRVARLGPWRRRG